MVNWLMEQLLEWLTNVVQGLLAFVVDLLVNLAFYVPDVTALPYTRQIWGHNMLVVNSLYILAVLAAGVIAMTYDTFQTRYGIKELLPRLFLGGIAANFSFAFLKVVLVTADAVIGAVAGPALGDENTRAVVETHVASALSNPQYGVLSLVLALLVVIMLIVVVFQWYVRLGVLVVLAIVGPLALATYALPRLDQAAGLWWRTLFGTLGVQTLQAVLLVGGLRVFLDPDAQLVTILPTGIGTDLTTSGHPVQMLVMIAILWATLKVSPLMRRWVLRGGGGGGALRIVAVLAVQQVTRGMSGRGGGRVAAKAVGR